MTDVRLTALNPVDSQVYPVACNTSGELIVEQVDPGPDLTVTGNLTVNGTSTFSSITAAGTIESQQSAVGVDLFKGGYGSAAGTFVVRGDGTIIGNETGGATTGNYTYKIDSNGNITTTGYIYGNGPDSYLVITRTGSTGTSTIAEFGGSTVTTRIAANGDITVAGDITCSDNSKGVVLKSPNGTLYRLSVANDGTLSTSGV